MAFGYRLLTVMAMANIGGPSEDQKVIQNSGVAGDLAAGKLTSFQWVRSCPLSNQYDTPPTGTCYQSSVTSTPNLCQLLMTGQRSWVYECSITILLNTGVSFIHFFHCAMTKLGNAHVEQKQADEMNSKDVYQMIQWSPETIQLKAQRTSLN